MEKWGNCLLQAIPPFPTVFSKDFYCRCKNQGLFGKGLTPQPTIPSFNNLEIEDFWKHCCKRSIFTFSHIFYLPKIKDMKAHLFFPLQRFPIWISRKIFSFGKELKWKKCLKENFWKGRKLGDLKKCWLPTFSFHTVFKGLLPCSS